MKLKKNTDHDHSNDQVKQMSNLANGRVILKFYNSVLVQNSFSSLYSNFMLYIYIYIF